jgi:hypothetical protein
MVVMQPSLPLLSSAVNGNDYAESGISMPNPAFCAEAPHGAAVTIPINPLGWKMDPVKH